MDQYSLVQDFDEVFEVMRLAEDVDIGLFGNGLAVNCVD